MLKLQFIVLILLFGKTTFCQTDIFEIMGRTDLRIDQVEKFAKQYFDSVGTSRGTGYKQYQRWLYERKFHLDDQGYFIDPAIEDKSYKESLAHNYPQAESYTWEEMGPTTWTYTTGWNPGVGRVTSVAVLPSNEDVIYVTSPGGGIWKTTDGGDNWVPLIDNLSIVWMDFYYICIDPNNSNVIYAGLTSSNILKSTDAGTTWVQCGTGPLGVRKIIIHPGNSNIVLAATAAGIYRSTNAGVSWTQVQSNSKDDIEFKPGDPNTVYASGNSTAGSVWLSSDNGVTWIAKGVADGVTNIGRTMLGVSPDDPNVVYAVQASGSVFGRLYKSTNSGVSYTTMVTGNPSAGTNYFGYEANGTGTTGQAGYDMAICVNPLDVDEVHIAGIICWKSTNGGSSFTATTVWYYPNTTGYNHADVHALEWINSTIYSGSDGGIYKSTNNAGDWTDLSAGLGIRQFYRLSCAKTDPNMITTGAQDNGSSYRQANGTWRDWLGADGMDNAISPTNANIAIGTSQNGAIYKTTNAGASYSGLSQPSSGNWVTPLVMHPTSHDTIWGGWTGIYRSDNGGSTWTNISASVITQKLNVLAVAPSNTKYIYGSVGSILYRTSDGGSSWSSITTTGTITAIAVSPSNPQKIWVGLNASTNTIMVSTDMGTTLTNISSGLPLYAARAIAVDDNSIESIYFAMNYGVFYRDSISNTWIEHATGLPKVALNDIEIQKSGGKLRVATYGRGVWESDLRAIECGVPTSLDTLSVSNNSASVTWNAGSGNQSFLLEYKLTSDTSWTFHSDTTTTSRVLTGLNASTSYDWRVKSYCANNNSSNFVQSAFTTKTNPPLVCNAPSNPLYVGTSNNNAIVRWNSAVGVLSYTIEYKLISAINWTVAGTTTDTTYGISGLSGGKYDWRVKSNCTANSSNYVTGTFTFYCPSYGQSTAFEFIDKFALNTLTRTSGSDGGYYNGTHLSTNLKPNVKYNLTFSLGFTGSKRTEYIRAYLDYNQNGLFTDAGELLFSKSTNSTGDTKMSFKVPLTASLGPTRIRLIMKYGSYGTPCEVFTNGEVEDYSVNITNTPGLMDEEEDGDDKTLSLYPVPATDKLTFSYYLPGSNEDLFGVVTGVDGKVINKIEFKGKAGRNVESFDLSMLPCGVYFFNLSSQSINQTQKFIVIK